MQSSVTNAADVHNVTSVSSVVDKAIMRNVCDTAQYGSYGHYARMCMRVQYSPVVHSAYMRNTAQCVLLVFWSCYNFLADLCGTAPCVLMSWYGLLCLARPICTMIAMCSFAICLPDTTVFLCQLQHSVSCGRCARFGAVSCGGFLPSVSLIRIQIFFVQGVQFWLSQCLI